MALGVGDLTDTGFEASLAWLAPVEVALARLLLRNDAADIFVGGAAPTLAAVIPLLLPLLPLPLVFGVCSMPRYCMDTFACPSYTPTESVIN